MSLSFPGRVMMGVLVTVFVTGLVLADRHEAQPPAPRVPPEFEVGEKVYSQAGRHAGVIVKRYWCGHPVGCHYDVRFDVELIGLQLVEYMQAFELRKERFGREP